MKLFLKGGENKSFYLFIYFFFYVSNLGGVLDCLWFYIFLVKFNKLISNYLLYGSLALLLIVIHIVYLSLFP